MADLIFTGGGTGGHLYPALAVADAAKATRPGVDILFVGTPDRIEAQVVPQEGYRFAAIPAMGLSKRPVAAARALVMLATAVVKARALLRREQPRAVLGTGGYVSAPVLLAARLEGVPVVLQEQNVVPGKVNQWIARFAHTVATSFPESARYFGDRSLFLIGNPIRIAAFRQEPEAARQALGYGPDDRVLLVTGGSQGAQRINDALVGLLPRLLAETDWHVLHVAGPAKHEEVKAQTAAHATHPRYRLVGYMDQMPAAILASELVLTRAGATTLAELTAIGKPMVLVPYPYAGGHQRLNAESIVEGGGGVEIPDAELTAERLGEALLPLMTDPARLAAMAEASRAQGKPNAAAELAAVLLGLAFPAEVEAGVKTAK
jgi:UDP-N-acetylglucosamine--N-acetylmuramyl-(pentapeptide) pyrophosphoryl-undecaprenol N-acetylglucosamine transferase